MANTNITTGSRVSANGGFLATVVSVKGRWVRIQFDHDGSEKNVGFKDVTPHTVVEKAALPKNGIVDPAARARYVRAKIGDVVCLDNGDQVAQALRGMDLDDIYKAAADVLDVMASDLRAKYQHLNNGQQRMNLGNRIRKAVKNDPALMVYVK